MRTTTNPTTTTSTAVASNEFRCNIFANTPLFGVNQPGTAWAADALVWAESIRTVRLNSDPLAAGFFDSTAVTDFAGSGGWDSVSEPASVPTVVPLDRLANWRVFGSAFPADGRFGWFTPIETNGTWINTRVDWSARLTPGNAVRVRRRGRIISDCCDMVESFLAAARIVVGAGL
jgi:hypothetical protein